MRARISLTMSLVLVLSGSICLLANPAAPYDPATVEYALTGVEEAVTKGSILFEYYAGANNYISSLQGLSTFPNNPDTREWRTSLEGPTNWRDNYGTRARGYLYPAATGAYTFWIASDDQSQLWLSPDEDPADKILIASVPTWTPSRDFDNAGGGAGGPQQKSSPIQLMGSRRYYIEVLHVDAGGADNLAVAWQGPGIPLRTVIDGQYLAPAMVLPGGSIGAGPAGWWRFDEASGTIASDSAGENDGVLYGNPVWQPTSGKIGGSLKFDGAGDYVDLPIGSLISSLTDSTFATWVNWSGTGGIWQRVFDFGSSTNVNMFLTPTNDEGRMCFAITTGGEGAEDQTTATAPLATGWHHVAVTMDAVDRTHTLYIDGQVAATKTAARYTPSSLGRTTQNWLGKSQYADPYFKGSLDDFRIYRRAMSAAEIAQLAQPGVSDANLVGWWKLDEATGTVAYDSAAGNAGILHGGMWKPTGGKMDGALELDGVNDYVDLPIGWVISSLTDSTFATWVNFSGSRGDWQRIFDFGSGDKVYMYLTPRTVTDGPMWFCMALAGWEGGEERTSASQALPSGWHHVAVGIDAVNKMHCLYLDGQVIAKTTGRRTPSDLGNTTQNWLGRSQYTADPYFNGSLDDFRIYDRMLSDIEVMALAVAAPGGVAPAATQSITLSPTSGPGGATVTITGSGFAGSTAGQVFFDRNGNGERDSSDPGRTLTTNTDGTFTTTLGVPMALEHGYTIWADFPVGSPLEASATFWLTNQGVTPSPDFGPVGTTMTIAGSGFVGGNSGRVFFDNNKNGQYDSGEPSQSVTVNGSGGFSATLTVPSVSAGEYRILTDCPSGSPVEASATFWVTNQAITLSRTSGPVGTTITIAGSGFVGGNSGRVFFDSSKNGQYDSGEPSQSVTVNGSGGFSATLTVPSVPAGDYPVLVDCPSGSPIEASAPFTVCTPGMTLSPTAGTPGTTVTINGTCFLASTAGRVFFDNNNNGQFDSGEPSQSVTTTASGTFSTTLTVPSVAGGTHQIYADIPEGSPVEASALFNIEGAITLNPTWGHTGDVIAVTGVGWGAGVSYGVYFDTNGDGQWLSGEPKQDVTGGSDGRFSTTLTVPSVAINRFYKVYVRGYCGWCIQHWNNLAEQSFWTGGMAHP